MKVKDFTEKYQLNDLFILALEEFDGELPDILFPIVNEEQKIDEKYINFYNMLKTLQPDESIKGTIKFSALFPILYCENSKNERLELLSWEEVLALDMIMPKEYSYSDLFFVASELLYKMTVHGKAFDKETKRRLIYEEKIKESLIPKMNSSKERFIETVKGITALFDSPLSIVPLGLGFAFVMLILVRHSFPFANLFALLIDTNLNTLPIKLLFASFVAGVFLAASWLNNWAESYLDKALRMKLKENIKNYLKEHPEAASFLSTEKFESLDYYFSKL
ncbi:hypothetical protein O163_09985 [Caldanaerobacter subterraneus subsp. yonseiensis KB-1]|uniref:Uncharacterized protein n=1 Tax=Caldanaerobacter subterraneus subsp. yonseiensis KB-1 TaxID=1388761 RepID=U5CRC4_CALSX|nr:hypothetical protein [Caldanaerobacter subterraneus]ERM91496.1 hypothetical protein O163_09985 [Caldanaerobacter subterraneus subsp. yonseiensis KB-1]